MNKQDALNKITHVSNQLDKFGMTKEADIIDKIAQGMIDYTDDYFSEEINNLVGNMEQPNMQFYAIKGEGNGEAIIYASWNKEYYFTPPVENFEEVMIRANEAVNAVLGSASVREKKGGVGRLIYVTAGYEHEQKVTDHNEAKVYVEGFIKSIKEAEGVLELVLSNAKGYMFEYTGQKGTQ